MVTNDAVVEPSTSVALTSVIFNVGQLVVTLKEVTTNVVRLVLGSIYGLKFIITFYFNELLL